MLGLFTASLLYYLWWGRFSYLHFPLLVAVESFCLLLILASHFLVPADLSSLGFGFRNFFRAGKWYGSLTLAGCLLIAAAGRHGPELNYGALSGAASYLAWAALQQYALQNFFLRLFLAVFSSGDEAEGIRPGRAMSRRTAILASLFSAAAFSLFHFPSLPFVAVTFAAAFFWCLVYTRTPSFYWAWFSHFLLGICLSFFLRSGLMGELQVGPGGYRYESYGGGVTVAAGYAEDGQPFIVTAPGPDRGTDSTLRVFSPGGELLAEWTAFEEYDFSAMVSAGDLGFGRGDEIVAVPGPGRANPPVVRIFSRRGVLLREFEILDPGFPRSYGAWVQVANTRIYLAPGPGPRSPQVMAEFSAEGELLRKWELPDGLAGVPVFVNGLRGVISGGEDPLLLRWGSGVAVNPSAVAVSPVSGEGITLTETLPTTYGLNLALVELGKGEWGIAAGPGPLRGYPPWIKVFSAARDWKTVSDIAPWDDPGSCGVNLAAVDIDGDGTDELVAGEGWGPDRPATVRILTLKGGILQTWNAF